MGWNADGTAKKISIDFDNTDIPNFITGRADIADDAAWEDFCTQAENFQSGLEAEYLNEMLEK